MTPSGPRHVWLCFVCLLALGCQERTLTQVRVVGAPDGRAQCARAYFERSPGDVVTSNALPIGPKRAAIVGVTPASADSALSVQAWAVGFTDPGCNEPTDPKEFSVRSALVFGETLTLQLVVEGAAPVERDGGGVGDAGVDGGAGVDAGVDAGTRDAGVDAGAQDAGGDAGAQDGGPTSCPSQVDCRLAACSGFACSDGLQCGGDKRCGNGQCLAATCTRQGSSCSMRCAEAGQCVTRAAPVALDYACDDGTLCTTMDRCDGDGGCVGVERACNDRQARGACYFGDVCVRADGGCAPLYADAGAPCDDGNVCTHGDTCDGQGACRPGSGCASTDCGGGTCTVNGCSLTLVPDGTPCRADGLCTVSGDCVALAVVPSNLPRSLARRPSAPSWTVTSSGQCDAVVETGSLNDGLDAGSVRIRSSDCSNFALPPFVVTRQLDDAGVPVLAFPLQSFLLGANVHLRFVGDRPVAFLTTGDITINGHLDFDAMDDSSVFARNISGAGGNLDVLCTPGRGAPGVPSGTRASGAGGGGFGSAGAQGGGVDMVNGGVGGPPGGNVELVPLRGGCGSSAVGGYNGYPGRSGGAVQLVAQGEIRVRGTVSANGHGGYGGRSAGARGGGGGGSGGGILLEASAVVLEGLARVIAHGGGGGSGADFNEAGVDGNDPPSTGFSAAAGGSCFCVGGNGGSGSGYRTITPLPGGVGQGASGGGGGGGGGHGRIRVNASSCDDQGVTARLSPEPSIGRAPCL